MPDESELDRIDPQSEVCKLSTGFTVEVVRMRTRQFFRLLRVLTHGAGPALMRTGLDFAAEPSEFASKLLMLVVMSIPDAEQDAIAFLASMCKPTGVIDKPVSQMTKQETADNQALWDRFNDELHNPDLTDTIDLIEVIVRQESPELQALGKKLERVFSLFQKTGQDKEPPEPEPEPRELHSTAPSQQPSTSSAASTAGPTSTSSTSRSAASGKSSTSSGDGTTASSSPA
jgi:hypothetical protein